MKRRVVVLDAGTGNVRSAVRALERAGADVRLTAEAEAVMDADGLVVPGVGAFGTVMDKLRAVGADRLIERRLAGGLPVLGICVGLQVLFESSRERGHHEGLGQWPGTVERLDAPVVPHMGWSRVEAAEGSRLFAGVEGERFYFVHSYGVPSDPSERLDGRGDPPLVTWARPPSSTPRNRRTPGRGCSATGSPPSRRPTADTSMTDTRRRTMTRPLQLLPAVDVVDGRAVRLVQGEAGTEQAYGDPTEAVASFVAAGATWIHLVDLDAAFGRGSNRELLARIVASTDAKVELSGGIRDDAGLRAALGSGAARVNLGTAALEDPDWTSRAIERYGERVAVGLDVRGQTLAARGWTREGGNLWEVLARLEEAGCSRYVVTDVARDGTLQGPNLDLLASVAEASSAPVVASGGVARLEDLRALRALVEAGVDSAIVGKALYAGAFTLAQAIEVAGEQR